MISRCVFHVPVTHSSLSGRRIRSRSSNTSMIMSSERERLFWVPMDGGSVSKPYFVCTFSSKNNQSTILSTKTPYLIVFGYLVTVNLTKQLSMNSGARVVRLSIDWFWLREDNFLYRPDEIKWSSFVNFSVCMNPTRNSSVIQTWIAYDTRLDFRTEHLIHDFGSFSKTDMFRHK